MRRKFVGNLILLLFLNFLVKPIWILGIDRSVQNLVGQKEYGDYFALFNFSIIFNVLLDLGLTHYNNQAIARNKVEVVRNFSNLASLKAVLGLVYLVVTVIAGVITGYHTLAIKLLLILSLNQFLSSFILFLRSNLSGLQLFRTDSILSVVDKTLMIIICGTLLYTTLGPSEFSVTYFALAQTSSYLITALLVFFIVLKKVKVFSWKFEFSSFKTQFKKSSPYALLILLMALYSRVDGVMLERMVSSEESGAYANAFRLLDMVNQVSYLAGVLLLSMFSKMLGNKENVSDLTQLSFNIVFTMMTAIAFATYFNADYIMELLYPNERGLSDIFQLLMLSSIAFGSTFIFGTLLTAANRLKTLNIIAVSGFMVNLILNLSLIPMYGAEGAAWATLFTQTIATLLQIFYSFKYMDLRFPKNYIFRFLGFLTSAIIGAYLLGTSGFSGSISLVVIFLIILALSVIFQLFNIRLAIATLKSRFK